MQKTSFEVFRRKDAQGFDESGVMSRQPMTEVAMEGAMALAQTGVREGHQTKLLFKTAGFSLAYAWFKSGYPLPRHHHNVDCLYYIVGGSLKIGTEELAAGDGFFVGEGVPYTYTPGPEGVEVLEFRPSDNFDIKLLANTAAYWAKAADSVKAERDNWSTQKPPSGLPDWEGGH